MSTWWMVDVCSVQRTSTVRLVDVRCALIRNVSTFHSLCKICLFYCCPCRLAPAFSTLSGAINASLISDSGRAAQQHHPALSMKPATGTLPGEPRYYAGSTSTALGRGTRASHNSSVLPAQPPPTSLLLVRCLNRPLQSNCARTRYSLFLPRYSCSASTHSVRSELSADHAVLSSSTTTGLCCPAINQYEALHLWTAPPDPERRHRPGLTQASVSPGGTRHHSCFSTGESAIVSQSYRRECDTDTIVVI